MLTWTPSSTNAEQNARDVLSAAMWMHSTYKDEIWLWRGQANKRFGLEPAMHTRVLGAPRQYRFEGAVQEATRSLLKIARDAGLDRQGDTRLPDLALLAHLQHHGAATPLVDVSTDPLIALWMIAFANAKAPDSLDQTSGLLLGIRRPPQEFWISPLDARSYFGPPTSISASLGNNVWWYQAPDVSERLRIQRGSFLLGPLRSIDARSNTTLPLEVGTVPQRGELNWLEKRMARRGQPSNTTHPTSELFGIIVRGSTKQHLRRLLEDRSGLSVEAVYPTPWHRPFIGQMAEGYGRGRQLMLDVDADDLNRVIASKAEAN